MRQILDAMKPENSVYVLASTAYGRAGAGDDSDEARKETQIDEPTVQNQIGPNSFRVSSHLFSLRSLQVGC